MPVVLNEMMWGLESLRSAVIGHLGSAAVASNSVAQVARQLAQVVVFGIAMRQPSIWVRRSGSVNSIMRRLMQKDLSGWHLLWAVVVHV